jgi:hypothetical protein
MERAAASYATMSSLATATAKTVVISRTLYVTGTSSTLSAKEFVTTPSASMLKYLWTPS